MNCACKTIIVVFVLAAIALLCYFTLYKRVGTKFRFLNFPHAPEFKERDSFTLTNYSTDQNGVILQGYSSSSQNRIQIFMNDSLVKNIIKPPVKHTKHFPYYQREVKTAKCSPLLRAHVDELKRINKSLHHPPPPLDIVKATKNCIGFKINRGYVTEYLTEEEKDFPIAFSILMYKEPAQVEMLLRAIYRPQNVYCIHVESKAEKAVHLAMESLVQCFDNVFLSSRSVHVEWGKFSVLEPELICMKDLWKYKKWKYFINLTGQEFPLKTNLQLVKILKLYNGANDVSGTIKRANKNRWKVGPPPHGIIPLKGSVHVVVQRGFVDYILHNQTAKDLLDWVKKTEVPDETFFATLNHNPQLGVPGAYTGVHETNPDTNPFLARFKLWVYNRRGSKCKGDVVRSICIFGVRDLPLLTSQPHLFANKLYRTFEHYALECLSEWHYNRTRDEFLGNYTFNDSYYKSISFVKNHI